MIRRSAGWVAALYLCLTPLLAAQHRDSDRPTVKLDGVVYAQYGYQFADAASDYNAFDLTRAYVNVRGDLGHGLTSRVTSDVYRVADGSLDLRLKYAYATWRPVAGGIGVTAGLMQTPWVDFEESMWGYRMQGRIALDRNGYLTSSDLGLGIDGSWNREAISFQAGVFNGEGYHDLEADRHKDAAARASVRLIETDDPSRTGGVRLSALGHYGAPTGGGVRSRAAGMLSWKSKLATLAAEYAVTGDREDDPADGGAPDLETIDGRLVTAFGVLRVPGSKVALIGRVDVVDPNADLAGDRATRYIGGVSYAVTPNLRVLADVDHVEYQTAAPTPVAEAAATQGLLQLEILW
ncbi:MAG TPA: hypothetical protein VFS94_10195 [Gemmatimonadales bacterium]|nr:hypothetical protein [Gemmatimonadales bacterium]